MAAAAACSAARVSFTGVSIKIAVTLFCFPLGPTVHDFLSPAFGWGLTCSGIIFSVAAELALGVVEGLGVASSKQGT